MVIIEAGRLSWITCKVQSNDLKHILVVWGACSISQFTQCCLKSGFFGASVVMFKASDDSCCWSEMLCKPISRVSPVKSQKGVREDMEMAYGGNESDEEFCWDLRARMNSAEWNFAGRLPASRASNRHAYEEPSMLTVQSDWESQKTWFEYRDLWGHP